MNAPLHWSREAESKLTMRRLGGEKDVASPAFWPGRPSLHHSECPLVADGDLLTLAHEAISAINDAQSEMGAALTSNHEFTDRELKDAQASLRKAIAKIEILRQRIMGAGEILESIERGAQS